MEIWKDIPGFNGNYQASNLGRIKGLKDRWGNTREKILKPSYCKIPCKKRIYAIPHVCLHIKGKAKTYHISRLVWTAFNGAIPQNYQIDHINNNPQDNRIENLQCITASENCKKKYTDNQDFQIWNETEILCLNNNKIYKSQADAAKELNLYTSNLNEVLKGKRKTVKGYKFIYHNK